VIGTTAGRDPGRHGLKADIRLLNLDLEAPAPADSRGHAPAVRLARLVSATSGRVAGNRLKGGMIEFEGGPWTIEENDYRGAVGGTVVDSIFAGHDTHDLILRKNRAKPEAGSGKTWRFLVLTRRGSGDAIEGNEVEGLGPRPGDGVPDMNAPEAILTESYQIRFEGRAAAISPDRTLVRLPTGRTDSPQVGDAVAILSGEGAGTWRRVAQVVGPNCIRLDDPLPVGARGISVAAGFFGMRIEANRLDGRGGTGDNLVLAGNHFGTAIVANRFLGGRHAFRLLATPTERPMPWGWSHAPFLGGRLERNVVVDADCGGKIAVEHSEAIKSNRGRVYLTMTARDNIFAHPSAPVDRRPGDRDSAGLNVGDLGSLDPGELVLDERNNRGDPGSADPGVVTFRVTAGVINGEPTSNRPRPWSAPPSP